MDRIDQMIQITGVMVTQGFRCLYFSVWKSVYDTEPDYFRHSFVYSFKRLFMDDLVQYIGTYCIFM